MLRVAVLLAAFTVSSLLAQSERRCDGSTINCRPHSEVSQLIKDLKAENRKILLEAQNCTVCWSDPCLNGGTCIPLGFKWNDYYKCECPENFGGKNCEKPIVCHEDSCGKNAECFVDSHQIICVCKPGFIGNPKIGCVMVVVEACLSGDPHYRTFDGQRYEYQGTCPYVFSEPCNGSLAKPYAFFSVKAKNELSYKNAHVSTVSECEVVMYDLVIHVDKDLKVYVNGARKKLPFYWPSKTNRKVTIKGNCHQVIIQNDQYVKVTFGGGVLCVEVPAAPMLTGNDTLCGLAGNIDGNCKNDFRNRDGSVVPVSNCASQREEFTERFGDTWITDDFITMSGSEICLTGEEVTNNTLDCDLAEAKTKCKPILDALTGQGVFAVCQSLGQNTIQNAYENCEFDVCMHMDLLCDSLATFAKICQYGVPMTSLDWRAALQCPELNCGIHANAAPCASQCPATCESPDAPTECSEVCLEGCECDEGYVLDYSEPLNPRCILPSQCGCTDADGNSHDPGIWLSENCTQVNICNVTFNYFHKDCSINGHCGVENFAEKCVCNEGFVGDGYNCVDIDECAEGKDCSGHGICINIPGSYQCECDRYYAGQNCELYLPMRHCMDLRKYHNKILDGVYIIKPSYSFNGKPAYSDIEVYCDMSTDGGGWTLMSNSAGELMSNKSFQQYISGFGEAAKKEVFLGLDIINGMTHEFESSLRLNLHHCAHNNLPEDRTYCVYPKFSILGASGQFAVVIPQQCVGTEIQRYDGWARWNLTQNGPVFIAYDNDNSEAHCSETFKWTGFWFDTIQRCGAANLNGVRYSCDNMPDDPALEHYLYWAGNSLSEVELYLRPKDPVNYDTNV